MTVTKTLVILTVPKVGKTWYKNKHDGCITEESSMKFPIVFDMGEYKDKSTKEQNTAFLNIIYITRKFHLNSIIMANGYKHLVDLMREKDIPYIALLPTNRYAYYGTNIDSFQEMMYMNRNSTFKNYFDHKTQYLSDRIVDLWRNEKATKECWFAYDRKWKFV